nr:hypothetical protein BaRGS_002834 [Batillaria attramentaria]
MTFGWSTFALILVFAGKGFLADGAARFFENTQPNGSKFGCPSEFSDLSPQHTLCLTDKGKAVTLTSQQKQAVVDRHNEIRGQVSPKATNMQKLVWDDSLAEVAGKWARQCVDDHDDDKNRALPGMPGVYIGQNMAYGRDDPVAATNYWQTEIKDFTLAKKDLN